MSSTPSEQNRAATPVLIVGVVALNLILLAALTIFSLNVVVSVQGLRFDFYPHYVAGHALWRGESPYSQPVTDRIQMGMWGQLLPPESDQYRFAYLAYTGLMVAPFLPLPAPVAIAAWMSVQLLAVLWAMLLWVLALDWKPKPIVLALLIFGLGFVFRYPIVLYGVAQFSGTMLLFIVIGAFLLLRGHDRAAGVALALASSPPTLGAPIGIVILGAFALARRWRGAGAYVVTIAALTAITMLQVGFWIPDFLGALRHYAQYAYPGPVWAPGLIPFVPLQIAFVVLVIISLGWTALRLRREPSTDHQIDLIIAALLAALLLLPQTGAYYLVLLIPAVIACVARARTLDTASRWIAWTAAALIVASPWFYWSNMDTLPNLQYIGVPLSIALLWVFVQVRRARTVVAVSR